MHDYETDPRPLSECLKEWQVAINGGKAYGARKVGQAALRLASASTYANLLDGRPNPYEATFRRLMTLLSV